MIDYFKDAEVEFENSTFWKKNSSLLIMFYLHEADRLKKDYKVDETILFEYPENDLIQIKKDFITIQSKIKNGLAHKLSESDTNYLGACTKGRDSSSVTTQPYSNILAKTRAYSLKSSYMTVILRNFVLGDQKNESIFKNLIDFRKYNIEEYLRSKIHPYLNKKTSFLMKEFLINKKSKSFRASIISKILDVQDITKTDEFLKSGTKFKTLLINKNNRLKESMSFPYFHFSDIYEEEWEESQVKEMFESTKFVFAVFKEDESGEEYFHDIVFWNMPEEVINKELKETWLKTKEVIKNGEIVKYVKIDSNGNKFNYTNFPKSTLNNKFHVRPHARDSRDVIKLPVRDKVTGMTKYMKHCFWLNSKYILEIVNHKDS
jgi:DNA mismatch repair protein MutH